MNQQPQPIVLGLVEHGDRILLVERTRGDFTGLWGFPGGKVERDEFIADAIEREVMEETGITATFDAHIGVVSEHVTRGGDLLKHVPLHITRLTPVTDAEPRGDADWFALDAIEAMRNRTVPSLVPILNAFLNSPEKRYYESVIVDDGADGYRLERFG